MSVKHFLRMRLPIFGERGSASVEYLVGALAVTFAVWVALSDFGQAAIKGIEMAGLDILGL